ncbi:MAG: pilus assembly protein [Parvibaculum sp.]|nr:pilus assembly protein [Parvibaculum sp.]|tara:strand:+ start:1904 stop:3193 length:1290 start_codon:yes stop_codon:yes gene_type:complete
MSAWIKDSTTRLGALVGRWTNDQRGSYAVIFAISLVPILIAIGAAVDLSQAFIVKQRLTRALDAAGLAVGGVTGQSNAELRTMAQNFFNANYPAAKIGVPAALTVTPDGNNITLGVTATMPTAVMGIVGINTLNIGTTSTITRMGKKLEVALVLDTTGSMGSSSKLTTMQTAAKDLIDKVSAAAVNPGDVKIAIVPFTVDVKVGTGYKTANWIKWNWTTPKTQTCTGNGNNRTCSDKSYSISSSSWKGCVIDRDQNYDISVAVASTSNNATLYPADNDDCYTEPLMPLSSDWTALKSKINDLDASGNTNTTIGMVWGWQMVKQNAILSNAAAPASNLDKVIVFLTDGDNTENRFTTSQSSIDSRTSALCTAIKADGIIVYTIRVMNGNATILKNCASDSGKYFSVTSASQLTTVFSSIAQALSNLRVSQ